MMKASHCNHAECVAEMLRLGADARRVDNRGRTALHWVAASGRDLGEGAEVVRLLVAAGCDAAVRDNLGRTAIEVARINALALSNDVNNVWVRKVEAWVEAALA